MEPNIMQNTSGSNLQLLGTLNDISIWGMGISFVLGSFFTLLILTIFDYIRRRGETEFDAQQDINQDINADDA